MSLEPQPLTIEQANRLKKLATIASVSLSSTLSVLKLIAAIYTGSLTVLSSLIDSLSDVFSSLITFVAVRFSSQPASAHHRYGFGKAEALSALFQSAFVAGSGLFVIYDGIRRFIYPQEVGDVDFAIAVMVISLVLTIVLVIFQKYVVRKTNSLAITGDSLHYVVDVATNTSIIITLVLVKMFGIVWFDTLAAIFISAYLLWNAFKLACGAISMLMDRELSDEIRSQVESLVKEFDFCRGMHDLRTRDLGGKYIFEFHLELDGSLPLEQAHKMTDIVEAKIEEVFPNSQVIIHQEPDGLQDDERLDDKL